MILASFSLTLNQQRLILACIAQVQDPREPIDRDHEFTVTAQSFSRLFNVDQNSVYSDLKIATKSLLSQYISINYDPDSPTASGVDSSWVSWAKYYDKEGKVVIKFSEKVLPYLSNLKEGCFSRYQIHQVAPMKSVYAIRLYEILVSESWRTSLFELAIEDLRRMFRLDKEYTRIFDLKTFVIDPSVRSINEHTDLTVTYTQRKTGRSVSHLVFAIRRIKPEVVVKRVVVDDEYIRKHARVGESWDQARRRLRGDK